MLSSVQSMGISGIEGYKVTVEAFCTDGMPMYELVGLPDAAVKESRERVRAAMASCQMHFPVARLTLNLAPADTKKEGPAFDLPIALAIMASSGMIDPGSFDGVAAVGELSLSGHVVGVRGALSMAIAAREQGVRAMLMPADNAKEAACVEGLDVLPVAHLQEAIDHLRGKKRITPEKTIPYAQLMRSKMETPELGALAEAVLSDWWVDSMYLKSGMDALVKELADAGVPLYVLSNVGYCFHEFSYKIPCYDRFSGIVLSCEEKLSKPDPALFRRMCERYGLKPEETLFVDDHAPNVESAKTIGLQGYCFADGDVNRLREHLAPLLER